MRRYPLHINVALTVVLSAICATVVVVVRAGKQEREVWYEAATRAIEARIRTAASSSVSGTTPPTGVARGVVLFVGDGMGMSTLTAARILSGQRRGNPGEETQLAWDSFPAVALARTAWCAYITATIYKAASPGGVHVREHLAEIQDNVWYNFWIPFHHFEHCEIDTQIRNEVDDDKKFFANAVRYAYLYFDDLDEETNSYSSEFIDCYEDEEEKKDTIQIPIISTLREDQPLLIDAAEPTTSQITKSIGNLQQGIAEMTADKKKLWTFEKMINYLGCFIITIGIAITLSSTYVNIWNTIRYVRFTPPCIINATVNRVSAS